MTGAELLAKVHAREPVTDEQRRGFAEREATEYEARLLEWGVTPEMRDEAETILRRKRLARTGVPEPDWEKLRKPDQRPALVKVRAWLSGSRWLAFLAGPSGSGKSFAAEWATVQRQGLYVQAADLVATGAFNDDAERWDEWSWAPFLAVDEMAREQLNAQYLSHLFSLLDARYRRREKTLLVSNLNSQAWQVRYGAVDGGALDSLRRRLLEGEVIELW